MGVQYSSGIVYGLDIPEDKLEAWFIESTDEDYDNYGLYEGAEEFLSHYDELRPLRAIWYGNAWMGKTMEC